MCELVTCSQDITNSFDINHGWSMVMVIVVVLVRSSLYTKVTKITNLKNCYKVVSFNRAFLQVNLQSLPGQLFSEVLSGGLMWGTGVGVCFATAIWL